MLDDINKKKQYLLLGVLVIFLLIIVVSFLKGNDTLDYKDINGAKLIAGKYTTNDREIYYTLESIIVDYIMSYSTEVYGPNMYFDEEYDEYYDVLSEEYKEHLSKSKYIEIAKVFLNKFILKDVTRI